MAAELRQNSSTRRSSRSKSSPAPTSYDVKCVVLGDGDVGKTSFLLTYLCGRCPGEVSPGPMDSMSEYDHMTKHPVTLTHDNTQIHMTLVDTYGQDEYDRLRERIGASADVYLLCFDVSRPLTFDRIKHHWLPEFRRYSAPDTPFLVIGLKTDIRSEAMTSGGDESDPKKFVTYGEGQRGARDMGAAHYLECSAKNNIGIIRAVEKVGHAAATHMLPGDLKRTSCVLS